MYVYLFECSNCGHRFYRNYNCPVKWTECEKCGGRAYSGA